MAIMFLRHKLLSAMRRANIANGYSRYVFHDGELWCREIRPCYLKAGFLLCGWETAVLVSDPAMNVLRGWCGLGLILVSLPVHGEAFLITSQRCAVNTWAEVSPLPRTSQYMDVDAAEGQTITNQSQSCLSSTNFGLTSLSAQATVDFQQTNILTATEFRFAHRFQMQSESQPPVGSGLSLRGFAAVDVTFRVTLTTPVSYQISGTNQSGPVLRGNGAFSIAQNTLPIVGLTWRTGIQGIPQAQGLLPVGTYDISFSDYALAEGNLFTGFENLVGGTGGAALTLTFTPEIGPAPLRPVLQIAKVGERVQLTMTNLQPGTHYFVRRGTDLTVQPWSVVANFTAGSSTVSWSEPIQSSDAQVFYRLQY
jgi:hypothetical protein